MANYIKGRVVAVTPKPGNSLEKELGPEKRQVVTHNITAMGGRPEGVIDPQWDTIKIVGSDYLYYTANFDLEIVE